MNAPFDPAAFKTVTQGLWNKHAQGWSDYSPQIRDWLKEATDVMLTMAEVQPGKRVLDIAAGAGDQTLDIALRVGATGSVLATDLSPAILKFAKERAYRAGYRNVDVASVDGEDLQQADLSFDAAVCRLGLMFFPEPAKGLREMFRVLKPGGTACTMVFSTPQANPCVTILISTAFKHAGMPLRDPYQPGGLLSLGKPGLIDELFLQAGFSRVATTKLSAPFRLPSAKAYVDFVRNSASPILQILERLDTSAKKEAWAEIETKLGAFSTGDGWEGPNELLITIGQRP